MAIIEKGTILAFCGGEYSDKWTSGPHEVIRDFDQAEVVASYRAGFVPVCDWDEPDEDRFTSWLTANGYIKDVEKSYRWYVGSYGEFAPEIVP